MSWTLEQRKTIEHLQRYIGHEDQIVHVNSSFQIEFEKIEDPLLKSLIRFLMIDDSHAFKKLAEQHLGDKLFGDEKPLFLKKVRTYFQKILLDLEPFLNQHSKEKLWGEIFIGHLLAYFTFLAPDSGEHLMVPLLDESKWVLIDYEIEKIYLTPRWMGSYAVAFGLKTASPYPPILLFKGTSYPTDEGFIKQLLTDVNPLASVGSFLFRLGRKNLQKWLTPKRHLVFGASLGGALAQHAANQFPDKILKAFAYNPPALLDYEVNTHDMSPEIYVIANFHDIVVKSGNKWSSNSKIYQIIPLQPRNFLMAHVQCYEAFSKHLILLKKVHEKGFFDYFISWGHLILSIPLFILGLLVSLIFWPFMRKKS